MGIFDKMKDPVFLKETSEGEAQLAQLKQLEPLLNAQGKQQIKQDIRCLEYGLDGERNIAFELKNSHMPIYVLHDIFVESGELSAQIDYIVVTKKVCFIIECKNLYGDIEIKSNGDFVRTIEFEGNKRKEGIYSPITQNQRHLDLLRKIKSERKNNFILENIVNKSFFNLHKSVVVLANPKTILYDKYARKEDKEKVIRADQLIKYIKKAYEESKEPECSDGQMLKWAQTFLSLHKENKKSYTEKYEKYMCTIDRQISTKNDEDNVCLRETSIFRELRAYRLQKSREEKIKPYFIYNDSQLEDLIINRPKSLESLEHISGFGKIKVEKYGNDIIEIMIKHDLD